MLSILGKKHARKGSDGAYTPVLPSDMAKGTSRLLVLSQGKKLLWKVGSQTEKSLSSVLLEENEF